jgi:hypothetical protein
MIVSTFGYKLNSVSILKNYTIVHNIRDGYDIAFIQDPAILEYMNGSLTVPDSAKVVLRMYESKDFWDQMSIHNAILNNKDKRVDMLLTWDEELLKLPYAVFCPVTDSSQWDGLTEEAFQIYDKSKLVSAISSNKAFLPGHNIRLEFINAIRNRVDLYGRGFHEIPTKLEGLRDYMFSVTIENCTPTNGFSEKIQDCFLAGTIPIYYGPNNIGEFYDLNGILVFHNQEELDNILFNLTPDLYYSKMQAIQNNYQIAFNYPRFNDSLYDLYFKQLI